MVPRGPCAAPTAVTAGWAAPVAPPRDGLSPPRARDELTLDQKSRWLAAAVEALPPALRETYVLCVIEEIPGKEAAQALGIREASLWRRLSDARGALPA